MDRLIRKCTSCDKYTMSCECPKCNASTSSPHPPRFSPDDKYVLYRTADRYRETN